jgi:hypothetical protein
MGLAAGSLLLAFQGAKRPPAGETIYVDTRPMPELTLEEKERGYILFTRNYLDMVFPASIPQERERIEKLRTFCTAGEYEPVTFCIRPQRPLEKVRVGISDLTSANGQKIPWQEVDVRQVRYMKRIGSLGTSPMLTPVLLEKVYPHINDYPAMQTQRIWLTVHVPEGTHGGLYRGQVRFVPGNAPMALIPIEVEVLPIRLLNPPVSYAMTTYEAYTREGVEQQYRDMRAHGMNFVKFEQMLGNRISMDAGKVRVDFDGNGYLEKALDPYKAAGFTQPFLWAMSGEPYGHYDAFSDNKKLRYGDIAEWCLKFGEPESKEFAQAYEGVIRAILDEGKRRKWPEIIFQPFNEPLSHANPLQDRLTLECLKILKGLGVKTELNAGRWPSKYDHMLPYLDYASYHDGPFAVRGVYDPEAWGRFLEVARTHHLQIVFYNFDTTAVHPEPMRFGYGPGLWVNRPQVVGALQWTYQRQDPIPEIPMGYPYLDNPDTTAFVYPESDKSSGGPTPGWEATREGVDDYRYFYTFMETARKAKDSRNPRAAKAADEGLAELDRLLSRISFAKFEGRPRQGKWSEPKREMPGGEASVSGTYKMENGWDSFDDYDKARRLAADWTLRLQSLLASAK